MAISMKVEASPGQDIMEACEEAIDVAGLVGINVEFEFNGVTCIAHPGDSPKSLAESFHTALTNGRDFKVATGKSREAG